MHAKRNVGILIFNDVEVLDFCGPFEVFGVTDVRGGPAPFEVYTVAEHDIIRARNSLSVNPHYTFSTCPIPDILIVPGGGGFDKDGNPLGTRREIDNQVLLEWLAKTAQDAEFIFSVCTGALLLAKLGLLKGLSATTHHSALDSLAPLEPSAIIKPDARWVDNGRIITSAGISAGIDASLHLVSRLLGQGVAQETATYMEYDWNPSEVA